VFVRCISKLASEWVRERSEEVSEESERIGHGAGRHGETDSPVTTMEQQRPRRGGEQDRSAHLYASRVTSRSGKSCVEIK
jgi:hypothetical protein